MLFRQTDLQPNLNTILNESTYIEAPELLSPMLVPMIAIDETTQLVEYDHLKRMMSDIGVDLDEAKGVLAETHDLDVDSIVTVIPEYEMILNPSLIEDAGRYVLSKIPETSDTYTFCQACVALYEETMDEEYIQLLEADSFLDLASVIMNDPNMSPAEKKNAIQSMRRVNTRPYIPQIAAQKKKKLADEMKAQQMLRDAQGPISKLGKWAKAAIRRHTSQSPDFWNNQSQPKSNSKLKTALKIGAGAAALGGIGLGIKKYRDSRSKRMQIAGRDQAGQLLAAEPGHHQAEVTNNSDNSMDDMLQRIQAEASNQPKTWLAKKIAALRHIYENYLLKAKEERSQNKAGIFKTIAAKILGVIDFLLKKLQNAVN